MAQARRRRAAGSGPTSVGIVLRATPVELTRITSSKYRHTVGNEGYTQALQRAGAVVLYLHGVWDMRTHAAHCSYLSRPLAYNCKAILARTRASLLKPLRLHFSCSRPVSGVPVRAHASCTSPLVVESSTCGRPLSAAGRAVEWVGLKAWRHNSPDGRRGWGKKGPTSEVGFHLFLLQKAHS